MVAVTAVHTTGIYCRSGCPARPLLKNTEPYRSAVAAEAAGFRACRRCRPDLEADTTLDATAPASVRRAVEMIGAGVLDTGTEAELAAAVGYSPRHLRRLFLEHVGATPDSVARSRRAHFARRLLDEPTLSITDIAFAAGFSSVRQMNRVMREVFRAAPSELRGRRHKGDAIDGGLTLTVPVAAPTRWARTVAHLGPRATPGVDIVEGDTYARTFLLCGSPGAIEIRPDGDLSLELTVHLPTYAGIIDVVHRVRRLAGLDNELDVGHDALAGDELLGTWVSENGAVRLPGAWDGFETAVRIIVGQQVSVAGASTLMGRVAERFGDVVDGLDRLTLTRLFPTAEQLADADLSGLGLTGGRAATIVDFARAVAGGEVDLDATADTVRQDVQQVKGVGPWTAEMIAMRVSRDLDAFPDSDLVVRDAVGRLSGESRPSAPEVRSVAERWRPYRAVAATHLWAMA